ncbi:MAG: hypothetical protein ACREDZ_15995, partial [Kiloniellales bacterium]
LPQGGLALRGGLAFVAELAQAADGCRLARFEFSTEQVYLVAFTDLEIRVYREGVLQATLASPYAAADLAGLDWTQSLDTMILVHPQHAPRRLLRQGSHSAWALSTLALTNPPKHEFGLSYPNLAITPGAVSGSGVTLAADAPWFEANDIQATVSGNGGIAKVTAFASASEVTVDVTTPFANTNQIAAGAWSFDKESATVKDEAAWSDRRGWPRSVYLFEGRLYFGGSRSRPQTVWGSRANKFFDFATTEEALDDEAVEMTLDNDRVSAVEQLYALDDLFAFTSGGLFVNGESPVSPANFYFQRHSELPAAHIRPVELDGSVAFVRRGSDGQHQSLYELVYDDAKQIYLAQDLALLASSLMRGPVDMAARLGNESDSANHLFVVNGDGTVAVLNSRRSQQITGWTLMTTQGQIRNVAVVGNEVYFLVERSIDGQPRFFVERLAQTHRLDASLLLAAGAPQTSWSGLGVLEGAAVALIGDGAALGDATVSGGAVETPHAVSTLEAGLSFDWAVETMPLEAQLSDGTLIGNRHRIVRATARVKDTAGLAINGRPTIFPAFGANLLDAPPPTFTGLKT